MGEQVHKLVGCYLDHVHCCICQHFAAVTENVYFP